MPNFTSKREKRLWLWVSIVLVTIYSTLFLGQPLAAKLQNQLLQGSFFMLGVILIGAVIVVHGIVSKKSNFETSTLLGIIAVYVLFIFRLGVPERSHVMEYSVLAIFVHKALVERSQYRRLILAPAILALIIAFLIGVLDEAIQRILPNRVFDLEDIIFNGIAVVMAIGGSTLLTWVRNRIDKRKSQKKQLKNHERTTKPKLH